MIQCVINDSGSDPQPDSGRLANYTNALWYCIMLPITPDYQQKVRPSTCVLSRKTSPLSLRAFFWRRPPQARKPLPTIHPDLARPTAQPKSRRLCRSMSTESDWECPAMRSSPSSKLLIRVLNQPGKIFVIGEVSPADYDRGNRGNTTAGNRQMPTYPMTLTASGMSGSSGENINVTFTPPPGCPFVVGLSRSVHSPPGQQATVETIVDGLHKKYGPGSYKQGATQLFWFFDSRERWFPIQETLFVDPVQAEAHNRRRTTGTVCNSLPLGGR